MEKNTWSTFVKYLRLSVNFDAYHAYLIIIEKNVHLMVVYDRLNFDEVFSRRYFKESMEMKLL